MTATIHQLTAFPQALPDAAEAPIVITQYDALVADIQIASQAAIESFNYEDRKGNKAARSYVFNLRKLRSRIDAARKDAKAYALSYGRQVDARAKELTDQVYALIEPHQNALDAIDQREAERVAAHRTTLATITALASTGRHVQTSAQAIELLAQVKAFDLSGLEEFRSAGDAAMLSGILELEARIQELQEAEAQAAEQAAAEAARALQAQQEAEALAAAQAAQDALKALALKQEEEERIRQQAARDAEAAAAARIAAAEQAAADAQARALAAEQNARQEAYRLQVAEVEAAARQRAEQAAQADQSRRVALIETSRKTRLASALWLPSPARPEPKWFRPCSMAPSTPPSRSTGPRPEPQSSNALLRIATSHRLIRRCKTATGQNRCIETHPTHRPDPSTPWPPPSLIPSPSTPLKSRMEPCTWKPPALLTSPTGTPRRATSTTPAGGLPFPWSWNRTLPRQRKKPPSSFAATNSGPSTSPTDMPATVADQKAQQPISNLRYIPIMPTKMLDLERSVLLGLQADYIANRNQWPDGSPQWIRADGGLDVISQILDMEGQ